MYWNLVEENMKLYVVRHGETDYNRSKAYYGALDVELNSEGRLQSEALGDFFRDIPIDHIISSNLKRSIETADMIAKDQSIKRSTDDRLAEQNLGIFEGLTYQELETCYPEEFKHWNDHWDKEAPPKGECFLDVYDRVRSFVKDMRRMNGNLLIVGHMGTLRHLFSILLDMKPTDFWCFTFEQGCYSQLDLEDGYAIVRKINQSIKRRY